MTAVLPLLYAAGIVAVTILLSLAICGGASRWLRSRRQRRWDWHNWTVPGLRIVKTHPCGCAAWWLPGRRTEIVSCPVHATTESREIERHL